MQSKKKMKIECSFWEGGDFIKNVDAIKKN